MKIGILTHQLHTNYGGILQNYALQVALIRMGHEVKTIDYTKDLSVRVKCLSLLKRAFLRLCRKSNLPLRGWTFRKEDNIISQHTREFVKQNIKTTQSLPLSDIKRLNLDFDAAIVGSDQVWRYQYLGENIKEFFFSSFLNVPIKIAYAASFGTDVWEMPNDMTNTCKELVREFRGVSVREDSGLQLCKEFLSIDAVHVLDPTMLLSVEDYVSLVEKSNISPHSGDLMTYILDKTTEKKQIIKNISESLKLTPIEVLPDKTFSEVGHKGLSQCIVPPIESWLRGFMDAKFVVTDSFHGTVFSVIFNKPFIVIGNANRGLSRMQSLLSLFGLEDRLITSMDHVAEKMNVSIDWGSVNKQWYDLRLKSLNFISNSLVYE